MTRSRPRRTARPRRLGVGRVKRRFSRQPVESETARGSGLKLPNTFHSWCFERNAHHTSLLAHAQPSKLAISERINELNDSNAEFRDVDGKPHIRHVTKHLNHASCLQYRLYLSVHACVRACVRTLLLRD